MQPTRQLTDEILIAHAAGLLAPPLDLLVRTHLSLCQHSRRTAEDLTVIGGALLDMCEPTPISTELESRVLAAVDRAPALPLCVTPAAGDVPWPLVPYVGDRFADLKWRRLGPVSEIRLLPEADGFVTRLLKIGPGAGVPEHTHEGIEATVVIKGAFRDCTGRYGPGDVSLADADLDHSPVAEPGEPCICLAVTDAPLRLTGNLGRLLNPFVRL